MWPRWLERCPESERVALAAGGMLSPSDGRSWGTGSRRGRADSSIPALPAESGSEDEFVNGGSVTGREPPPLSQLQQKPTSSPRLTPTQVSSVRSQAEVPQEGTPPPPAALPKAVRAAEVVQKVSRHWRSLEQELKSMKLKALKQRARQAGVDEDAIADVSSATLAASRPRARCATARLSCQARTIHAAQLTEARAHTVLAHTGRR